MFQGANWCLTRSEKNPPGPPFPHVLYSTLHHGAKLHLVLGVRIGQNNKVTQSQPLKGSPSPKDTLHHKTRARACQEPSEVGEQQLPVHHQQVKEALRLLARASHGYLGAGKVCDLFPAAHTTFFFGKLSSKWLCLQCMGKAASWPAGPCHGPQEQRSAPEAKGVMAESGGRVQGQARGAGENCSAWSPKGWCAIKKFTATARGVLQRKA